MGELCLYFLRNEGTKEANSIIALTQVTPESNKTPIIFPGEFLGAGTIGDIGNPQKYAKELSDIKNFPDETILASKYTDMKENLDWIKVIDPSNRVLEVLEEHLKKKAEANPNPTPAIGFLGEERMYNPYLRLNEEYFVGLAETTDQGVILQKIKEIELSKRAPRALPVSKFCGGSNKSGQNEGSVEPQINNPSK